MGGRSLPRMRGDRPSLTTTRQRDTRFTPHARGSTLEYSSLPETVVVYPACAGIDLNVLLRVCSDEGLPRMRGDRPQIKRELEALLEFTPHARGSTLDGVTPFKQDAVYPACAGIDLEYDNNGKEVCRLPRMR